MNSKYIPSWIEMKDVALDQFFTQDEVAQKCYASMMQYLQSEKIDTNEYMFIEPSAGCGSFYKLMPDANKIAFDIMPLDKDIMQQDFLSWKPLGKQKNIFIGNPPFGKRSWLALAFMNHASQFAEYIGFIVPMSFQSDGKGTPKSRVKGMQLVHSEEIPAESFFNLSGEKCRVNALWQIWKKGENITPFTQSCFEWLDIFTVDMRKEKRCGHMKVDEADYFLQRTFYTKPPVLVHSFSEVKYVCGYGLIIKKDTEKIVELLNTTDWLVYSNLSARSARHISMYHIVKVLTDKGFIDE